MIDHILPHGVAILQYADDTIIFLKHDLEGAVNMKFLLYMYEMMAGLKINFNKSEVIMISQDDSKSIEFSNMFICVLLANGLSNI